MEAAAAEVCAVGRMTRNRHVDGRLPWFTDVCSCVCVRVEGNTLITITHHYGDNNNCFTVEMSTNGS